MNRILIIGNSGSGKTTFAKELANLTDLPLIHLDKLFWNGCWKHISKDEFDELLDKELKREKWIIDGNFDRTLIRRISYCDTIFFYDFKTIVCLWGATIRVFRNYGKTRDDMGGDCPEFFDKHKIELYKSIIKFNKNHKTNYLKLLNECVDKKVIIFKNRRQVRKYLNDFSK